MSLGRFKDKMRERAKKYRERSERLLKEAEMENAKQRISLYLLGIEASIIANMLEEIADIIEEVEKDESSSPQ